eukprot:5194602-Pyramimonas_sp.AAC.1
MSAKSRVYHRESEDVRSGLRLARQDERVKWRKFNAAVPIDSVDLQNLFREWYSRNGLRFTRMNVSVGR